MRGLLRRGVKPSPDVGMVEAWRGGVVGVAEAWRGGVVDGAWLRRGGEESWGGGVAEAHRGGVLRVGVAEA